MLLYAARGPLMPEYAASLPIPGVDGTLRRRLTDSPASDAHIKTGYLDGVRAIAGYVMDNRGRMLVVVSMINHPQAVAAQTFQEAVFSGRGRADQAACAVTPADSRRRSRR